jgi:hypothetical protein
LKPLNVSRKEEEICEGNLKVAVLLK